MNDRQLITHSRQDCFKRCRKRHWFTYELGLRPVLDAKALRMGSAYHLGLEMLAKGKSADEVSAIVWGEYEQQPDNVDVDAWHIEAYTVTCLLSGYAWYWSQQGLRYIAPEQSFRLPLLNPETSSPSTAFDLAGKTDGIVELPDSRLAVLESKLQSEDLGSDSPLWRRLEMDQQITLYVHAARRLGWIISTVLYDATRKPIIKPTDVPLLDNEGLKVVLDADGQRVLTAKGTPRQTADTAKGYVLQSRAMTPAEWAEKLTEDIGQRPEWYYARREVPRLDQQVWEFETELWDFQKTLREAQLKSRWYRTVTRDSCPWCPYVSPCYANFNPETSLVPEGFTYVTNIHPELGDTNVESTAQVAAETVATPAGQEA